MARLMRATGHFATIIKTTHVRDLMRESMLESSDSGMGIAGVEGS